MGFVRKNLNKRKLGQENTMGTEEEVNQPSTVSNSITESNLCSTTEDQCFVSETPKIFYTTKKTFIYNFFPTKEEEESLREGQIKKRILVEIRDYYPPPVLDLENFWKIKKTLNHDEIAAGRFMLSFNNVFEHVIRYWTTDMSSYLVDDCRKIVVTMWDVTVDEAPRKYQNYDICLYMIQNDDFVITCLKVMRDGNWKVGDEILLYWEPKDHSLRLKLVAK